MQLQTGAGEEIREVHQKALSVQMFRVGWAHAATHLNRQVLVTEDFSGSDAIPSFRSTTMRHSSKQISKSTHRIKGQALCAFKC